MAERTVKIWYDPEGDYLEVIFDPKPGYFRETASNQVMVKVDDHGNILGFSVLKVSSVRQSPLRWRSDRSRPCRAKECTARGMPTIGWAHCFSLKGRLRGGCSFTSRPAALCRILQR